MLSKKVLLPVVALAMAAFFGCESETTSATNVVPQNTSATQDSTVTTPASSKDSVVARDSVAKRDTVANPVNDKPADVEPDPNSVLPDPVDVGGDTSKPAATGKLVSCDVTTIGNAHSCIEADAVFADSVKMMCDPSSAYILSAVYQERGCDAGAAKTCVDSADGESATIHYYNPVFATMSCENLIAGDLDDYEDLINVELTGEKVACSNSMFCAEGDAAYASECDEESGSTLVDSCPAGGEKCDLGFPGFDVYVYPGSIFSCDLLKTLMQYE